MSKALFIGFDGELNITEYDKAQIFANFEYPDSLYVQDGILFDKLSDGDVNRYISKSYGLVWYEVKAAVLPFECESRVSEVTPDLYKAAYRITEWFINYLKEYVSGGNMPHLLQRWLGDKDLKKPDRKTVKVSSLHPEDCAIPYDVLLKIR